MKIITCTGFYGTGSSAVTDFFKEFSNCASIGDYEIRFIHDPNGIRDLEYNLIENNQRHNTSHAIKQFIKYMKHLNGNALRGGYKRHIGDTFEAATKRYICGITELCCDTWWHYDQISRGELFNDIDLLYQRAYGKINHGRTGSILKLTHEKGYYSAISREQFYALTKKFIAEVFQDINPNQLEYTMIDQLLPPTNVDQYLNYFDEIKVVIVDRDPRDCYLLESEVWCSGTSPYRNVEEFCKWFEIIRRANRNRAYDPEKVLQIKFEDLIYDYENTTRRLIDFVGIDASKHISPRKFFDPAVSIKNTDLKKRYPHKAAEINYIEEHLQQFLYPFDKYKKHRNIQLGT